MMYHVTWADQAKAYVRRCRTVEDRFTTELIIFAKIDWPVQWTYSHSQCQAFFLETVY